MDVWFEAQSSSGKLLINTRRITYFLVDQDVHGEYHLKGRLEGSSTYYEYSGPFSTEEEAWAAARKLTHSVD